MKKIVLGGRAFAPTGASTAEHHHATWGTIHRAGLRNVTILPGENADDFTQRVLAEAMDSGYSFLLLGCFLIPEGTDPLKWSRKLRNQTARFLSRLSTPEDIAGINAALIEHIVPFMTSGLVSLWTSGTYSEGDEPGPGEAQRAGNDTASGAGSSLH